MERHINTASRASNVTIISITAATMASIESIVLRIYQKFGELAVIRSGVWHEVVQLDLYENSI